MFETRYCKVCGIKTPKSLVKQFSDGHYCPDCAEVRRKKSREQYNTQ